MNNTKSPNDKLLPLARPKPQCHEIFVPKLAVGENVLDVDTNLSRPAYLGHISLCKAICRILSNCTDYLDVKSIYRSTAHLCVTLPTALG